MEKTKIRRIVSVVCNLAAAALTVYAWCLMSRNAARSGNFSIAGIRSLRYFTVESNVLNGIVSIFYAVSVLRVLRGRQREISPLLQRFRLMAADAVGLTFLVVAVFLGPRLGYRNMLKGANLYYHLLLPLLSMLSFCLLDYTPALPKRACLFAALPVPLYGTGYVINVFTNNYTGLPSKNDWYGFVSWGLGIGICIFALIILAAALMGLGLLTAARKRARRPETDRI